MCFIWSIAANECSDEEIALCGNHSQCTTLNGSASCTCDKGYTWNNTQCEGNIKAPHVNIQADIVLPYSCSTL